MAIGWTIATAQATRSNGNPGDPPGAGASVPAVVTVSGGPALGTETFTLDVSVNASSENPPSALGPYAVSYSPKVGETEQKVAYELGRIIQGLACVEAGNATGGVAGASVYLHVAAMGTIVDVANALPAPT